ncbi:BnaC03g65370D [Brassica napus]|uniref:BnaC03g65370D protein n=1 Tax=Brassica napus TaxID=3708 RepID=A0A078FX24_BRANA|nr:BnaC03g65370D [Brassica napus]
MVLSFHVRSNSFPSRQHPQAAHVDEQLNRLRSSQTASSSSSSSICQILSNLHDLHDSLDKMFRLSISQQTLSQDQILDLCTISKDDLSKMKESQGDRFLKKSFQKSCGKWSLVAKMMSQNKAACEAEVNEFTRVDLEFQSEKSLKIEDVQNLDSCIQHLEDGIESLSKSLIKYRVSILNI